MSIHAEALDWQIDEDIVRITEKYSEGFDLIVAADVLYKIENLWPFASTCSKLLQHAYSSKKLNSRCIVCYQLRNEHLLKVFENSILPFHGLRMEEIEVCHEDQNDDGESNRKSSLTADHIKYTRIIELFLLQETSIPASASAQPESCKAIFL
mmetsp:Transcript_5121/g.5861  ORF Transcript_5121/g.5861 Transcript_5121/m.5861 type:complete len:153 (+) Transcript_5121:2-460(+)